MQASISIYAHVYPGRLLKALYRQTEREVVGSCVMYIFIHFLLGKWREEALLLKVMNILQAIQRESGGGGRHGNLGKRGENIWS